MSPPELGAEDDDFDFEDSFGTTPASSGGGGGGGGGGLPAAPSVSSPAAATPGIGVIPPVPPAASAGSAGGAGARMPMGGMMPPMMGGLGGGLGAGDFVDGGEWVGGGGPDPIAGVAGPGASATNGRLR